MAATEGGTGAGGGCRRRGLELEKFKRRMIRSVARRIKDKKTDKQVWEDMKKEIGSNCKKLWERMRMLTLKKLKRLLEADDRIDLIGPVARMTLTDWLLFDLVIVHEKIDVIDREKLTGSYQSKVLSNLFSLVQRFEIEGRAGENLAEAWTAATVYYNSKGHQCSPMMLQRRWFQIKELTRHKFYKFWFNYRGNQRQLVTAKQDSPDDLQKAIALKYPEIVTQKFDTWEERIENRMVILPDELSVKMRQRNLMKASDTTAPDVVLVEPHIEVIDLGANSDSEEGENETQNEAEPQLLVKIKSEPVDGEDNVEGEHEILVPYEKGSELNEEIERLQMVEDNFDEAASRDDAAVLQSIVIDPVPSIDDQEIGTQTNEVLKEAESGFTPIDANEVVSFSIVDGEITNVQRNEESITIDDDDDDDDDEGISHKDASTVNDVETVTAVMSNDNVMVEKDIHIDYTNESPIDETNESHFDETNDSHFDETNDGHIGETVDEVNGAAESPSVASAGVRVENMDDDIESNRTDNLDEEQTTGDDGVEVLLPIISTVSSAGIKVEKDLAVCSDIVTTTDNDYSMSNDTAVQETAENIDMSEEISEALPVISNVSSVGVKVEMEIETVEDNIPTDELQSEIEQNFPEGDLVTIEDDIHEPTDSLVVEKDPSIAKVDDLESFGAVPIDLNFADDGIEFADDGIAYVEEDEDDIITVRDPPSIESEKSGEELKEIGEEEAQENEKEELGDEEKSKVQKFDLKLLMCPVVYTTKLDAMNVFDDTSQYEQVCDKESIDIIYTLSKPVSKQYVTESEQVIEQEEENDASYLNMGKVDDNNDTGDVSDDDLFRNESFEESNDSDSEAETIDESKRVNQSSYMLQKPKYRSYNPVLLCKNPDFNTRLKKLSVGFFMSARNRTLLQSCIPMTIDMTKAFEDKLVNGTLYLKPSPTDSVINIQDDIVLTSAALVKPSAVQQSLMNIDETLENELKKRMAERVRAINLPDISEVRRLNQHLLTAEVTPLRLENEISQDDAAKTGPRHYVQNIQNDIDNLLSEQKTTNVSNSDSNIDPIIPEVHPSPTPLVVDNNPVLRVQATPPPMVSIPDAPPPPQVVGGTASSTTHVDDPNTATNSGLTKVRKATRKTYYPPVAWNQRPHFHNQTNQEHIHTDALLTIDTLYKMLSALDPCSKVSEHLPKKKSHKKIKQIDTYNNVEKAKEDKTKQDVVIDITDDEAIPVKKPRSKPKFKTNVRTKDREYCCWCSYRIDYLKGNICKSDAKRRHRCKPCDCVCCCKELYTTGDLASVVQAVQSIELEQEDQHISQTIEHVVQHVDKLKTMADASIQINLDENDSHVAPLSDNPSSNKAVLTQTSGTTLDGISLNSSDDVAAELTPLSPSKTHQTIPTFRVFTGVTSKSNAGPTVKSNIIPKTKVRPYNRNYGNTNNVAIRPNTNIRSKPHQFMNVEPFAILPNSCTCRPNISQVNQGRIEINGRSNSCILHKKQMKENKIVLSKKLVTDENQPFFVGKGKILLTNKKMPSKRIEKPADPAPAISQSNEVQSISLPAGVQVVLLANQTLTYVIQPDVTLTPEECAILPQFLVAIQQQINALGITLPTDHPIAKIDEIIDLDKDESTSKPESSTAANVTDLTEPMETNPSPELGDKSATEESTAPKKDFEIEIESLAQEKRATAGEDFEMRIDSLAVEQQTTKNKIIASGENSEPMSASAIEKPENHVLEPNLQVTESETSNSGASTENLVPLKDNFEKEPVDSSTDEATNKKSLLSDLMEMSGIIEEDLAPPPLHVITPQEPIILDTSNFILQLQVPTEEKRSAIPMPGLSPISSKQQYTATNKSGNIELTAVTSFAELKYSCDNDGLFFKLDLETGQLTSINVCIQKFPSTAQPSSEKTVIDLTDDPDISITGTTEDGSNSLTRSIIALNEPSPPNKTQITTILRKKQRQMQRLSNNLKRVNISQSKKHVARILKRNKNLLRGPQFSLDNPKLQLNNIEAKIDLVDSDAPMEEEYLVDNSDDSSDDEPLFKKAKRMHSNDTAGSSIIEPDQTLDKQGEEVPLNEQGNLKQQEPINIQDHLGEQQRVNVQELASEQPLSVQHSGAPEQLNVQETADEQAFNEETHVSDPELVEQPDDYIDQEEDSEEEIDDMSQPSISPVPTHLVLSGGALNAHNIPLNTSYGAGDEDSQDEDCILGV